MKITAACLAELLGEKYRIVKKGSFSGDNPIDRVSLWTGGPSSSDTLYLNTGSDPVSGACALNVVTNKSKLEQDGWYLYCDESERMLVVNDFFRIWQEFLTWRSQCTELAKVQHDLSALLKEGGRYLGADLIIIDRDYRYDGGNLSADAEAADFFRSNQDMDTKAVEDLYVINPRFDDTFITDGLVYYPYIPFAGNNLYYYNLRYDRLYLGRLLLRIPVEKDAHCFRHLADQFGSLVSLCYEYHYLRKNKGMPRHSVFDLWKLLLSGKSIDRELTNLKLRAMNWESNQRYQILYLLSNGYFRSSETLKFYAAQLEQAFPCCIAAQTEECIYVLHNLTQERDAHFRQHLADFLRENLFISGVSNDFHDFYDSSRYAHQAKDALELGIRKNPSLWRHEFRNYQADYLYQQLLARYTARDLCPEDLEKLLRYDELHPEMELAKTLEIYYQCKFNAAEAARKLYIHRTTLFYRLNKIQQIAAIDYDDPVMQVQIPLCFALLREEAGRRYENKTT